VDLLYELLRRLVVGLSDEHKQVPGLKLWDLSRVFVGRGGPDGSGYMSPYLSTGNGRELRLRSVLELRADRVKRRLVYPVVGLWADPRLFILREVRPVGNG